mmetsp:Transcript_10063/g.19026  ORF Transcript_10063/g.19026 Transcript_10063/m.19026 type:complete len:175 (+) Transcript_10063:44-568(+)
MHHQGTSGNGQIPHQHTPYVMLGQVQDGGFLYGPRGVPNMSRGAVRAGPAPHVVAPDHTLARAQHGHREAHALPPTTSGRTAQAQRGDVAQRGTRHPSSEWIPSWVQGQPAAGDERYVLLAGDPDLHRNISNPQQDLEKRSCCCPPAQKVEWREAHTDRPVSGGCWASICGRNY